MIAAPITMSMAIARSQSSASPADAAARSLERDLRLPGKIVAAVPVLKDDHDRLSGRDQGEDSTTGPDRLGLRREREQVPARSGWALKG